MSEILPWLAAILWPAPVLAVWWLLRRVRPRHTPESVAADILRGLRDGSVKLP